MNLEIHIDVKKQLFSLLKNAQLLKAYPCSTAREGTSNTENSYKTPLGQHRIAQKIGDLAPKGAIFKDREPTGQVWQGEDCPDDLILTRILWLEGLEPGVNQGEGVDTFNRYIYIHGTNHEELLGTPASLGCIRLSNRDVTEVFDLVDVGTLVQLIE